MRHPLLFPCGHRPAQPRGVLPLRPTAAQPRKSRIRNGFTLVELLVVIGIAAMLITLASTSFFGAMRQESVTKSRNQLRDILLMARQQACILGKTHVVVCWNSDTSVIVGDKKQEGLTQGRYALFQGLGSVWKQGSNLYAAFGVQSDVMATLKKGARVISLAQPDAKSFARVSDIVQDPTKSESELDGKKDEVMLPYDYSVGGKKGSETWRPEMFKIAEVSGTLAAAESNRIPLAVRVTSTFSLPKLYKFNQNRIVFVFTPDGCLDSSKSAKSVTASHSAANNAKNATFTLSVSDDGVVKIVK